MSESRIDIAIFNESAARRIASIAVSVCKLSRFGPLSMEQALRALEVYDARLKLLSEYKTQDILLESPEAFLPENDRKSKGRK